MRTADRLRARVLDLAIRGALVPQDPAEGSAEELFDQLSTQSRRDAEKRRETVGRAVPARRPVPPRRGGDSAPYPPPAPDEIPFPIPATWAWVRLGEIGDWGSGATPSRSNSEYFSGTIPWVLTGDLHDGDIESVPNSISEKALRETSVRLNPPGSILMAMYGATIGKLGTLKISATTNQACCACIPNRLINPRYLFFFLLSQRDNFRKRGSGGAQPNISKKIIVETLLPLPPLAEQKRIVAKVEEIFAAIDEAATAADGLAAAADKLDRKILDLAIRGALVPQDSAEGSAEELFDQLSTQSRRDAEKRREPVGRAVPARRPVPPRRGGDSAPYPPPAPDEIPFPIPATWAWVRLGDVSTYGSCEGVTPCGLPPSTWSLDLEDIEKGTGRLLKRGTIGERPSTSMKHRFSKGMVLFSKLRVYLNKVLIAEEDGICTTEIVPFELLDGIVPAFVRLVMISSYFQGYASSKDYGVKMPRVGTKDMQQFLLPLPPLAEQKRIVAKVEALRAALAPLRS